MHQCNISAGCQNTLITQYSTQELNIKEWHKNDNKKCHWYWNGVISYLCEERSDENEEDIIHKQEAQKNHTDLWSNGKKEIVLSSWTAKYILTLHYPKCMHCFIIITITANDGKCTGLCTVCLMAINVKIYTLINITGTLKELLMPNKTQGRSAFGQAKKKWRMKGVRSAVKRYLEIGQWNGLHEVEAECNAEEILQDPDPSTSTQKSSYLNLQTNIEDVFRQEYQPILSTCYQLHLLMLVVFSNQIQSFNRPEHLLSLWHKKKRRIKVHTSNNNWSRSQSLELHGWSPSGLLFFYIYISIQYSQTSLKMSI